MFKIISQVEGQEGQEGQEEQEELLNSDILYKISILPSDYKDQILSRTRKFKLEGISDNDLSNLIDRIMDVSKYFSNFEEFFDFYRKFFARIDINSFSGLKELAELTIKLLSGYQSKYFGEYGYDYSSDLISDLFCNDKLRGLPEEVIRKYLPYIKEERYGKHIRTLKVLIFWKNYPELITDDSFDHAVSKISFLKSSNFEGVDKFLIEFKQYLSSPIFDYLLNTIKLSNEANIISNEEIYNSILKEIVSHEKREIMESNYPKKLWPLLRYSSCLIGVDPKLIKDNIYDKMKDLYGLGSVKNNTKLLSIFGERYNEFIETLDNSQIRQISDSLPDYTNFNNYKYMGDFLINNPNLGSIEINDILSLWSFFPEDIRSRGDTNELLSYLVDNKYPIDGNIFDTEEKRERIKRRYPSKLWPILARVQSLNGINPKLIEDIFNKVIEKNQKLNNMNITDIGKLISIFWMNPEMIETSYLPKVHDISNSLPNFKNKNDYKYMDIFLRTYSNWEDPKLKIIINNWNKFPEEIRKPPHDLDKLYNHLINEILPQVYKNLKVNNKDFISEFFLHGVGEKNYNRYENIYIKSQNVPLPRWTKIEPIENKGFRGYFVPRSDTRTMFIGDYVTCCQKIDDAADTSAVHSQISPYGALFLIDNIKTGNPTAQSWVWENSGNIVFDNIECVAMKGPNPNDKIAEIIMGIYKEAARRIKELGAKSVSVGYAEYGINTKYLDDLPAMKDESIEGPEDEESFMEEYFTEKDDEDYFEEKEELYTDADDEKRLLAKIYNKMLKISNRIDNKYSDISDKIDRLIK